MAEQVSSGLTEDERRALVRRVSERGSAGYRAMETATAPVRDYAAAADAAVAADPVELPPAATQALSELTGRPVESSDRYAEAQRSIFEQAAQRELDYGNQYYDDVQRQIAAHNRQLDDYALALQQQADAAAAAAYRGRGGRGGSDPTDVTDDDDTRRFQPTPTGLYEASTELHGPRRIVREVNPEEMMRVGGENLTQVVDDEDMGSFQMLVQAYPDYFADAAASVVDYISQGYDKDQTLRALSTALDRAGLSTQDASRIANWVVESYRTEWDKIAPATPVTQAFQEIIDLPETPNTRGTGPSRKGQYRGPSKAPASAGTRAPQPTPNRDAYGQLMKKFTDDFGLPS